MLGELHSHWLCNLGHNRWSPLATRRQNKVSKILGTLKYIQGPWACGGLEYLEGFTEKAEPACRCQKFQLEGEVAVDMRRWGEQATCMAECCKCDRCGTRGWPVLLDQSWYMLSQGGEASEPL